MYPSDHAVWQHDERDPDGDYLAVESVNQALSRVTELIVDLDSALWIQACCWYLMAMRCRYCKRPSLVVMPQRIVTQHLQTAKIR